jgi:hypothetical protein
MGMLVTAGASLQCSFGAAPSTLSVLPGRTVVAPAPAATIMDHVPMVNVMPFGMCSSISNPEVAAATSAALGVLTPMPCVPVLPAPWAPGSPTVTIGGLPALTADSTCECAYAGVISILDPGQFAVQVAG